MVINLIHNTENSIYNSRNHLSVQKKSWVVYDAGLPLIMTLP